MKKGKRQYALAALVGTAMAGAVALAPAASAADTGGGCRSSYTGDWAVEPGGVDVDACVYPNPSHSGNLWAQIGFVNVTPIDPCAQLINVATGAWTYDYGCIGWQEPTFEDTYSDILTPGPGLDVAAGKYVVQVGFWAHDSTGVLRYYGNVQSPVITVG